MADAAGSTFERLFSAATKGTKERRSSKAARGNAAKAAAEGKQGATAGTGAGISDNAGVCKKRQAVAAPETTTISGEWSEEEVADLRMAHMCVNPTRTDFWEEVAKQVGKKTAHECHAKWFKQFDSASPKRGAQTNQQTQSDRKRTRAAMSASNAR